MVLVVLWDWNVFCFSHDRRKRGLQSRDAIDRGDHRRNLTGDCDLRGIRGFQNSLKPQLEPIPVWNRSRALHCSLVSKRTTAYGICREVQLRRFCGLLAKPRCNSLDVSPMNMREVFLEVVGKGEANVHVEILA